MTTYKVAELQGSRLNAAVAKAEGLPVHPGPDRYMVAASIDTRWAHMADFLSWREGGPIIEREHISVDSRRSLTVEFCEPQALWMAYIHDGPRIVGCGPTPLIAAMRAYVAIKYGEEVDLP